MLLHRGGVLGYTGEEAVRGLRGPILFCKEEIAIRTQQKRVKKIWLIAGIAAAAVALAVFLGVLIWGLSLKNGSRVFPNICVSGVNIGGMEAEEAAQALESSLASTHATRTLTVQLPDRKLVFDPEMANSPMDTSAMVDAAMAYGRDGSVFKVISTYLSCKKSAYLLDLEDFLQVDTEYIRELIDKTAQDVARDVVQSEVTMDEENEVIRIQLGYTGRSLDADKLYDTVLEAYRSGDLSDITFNYDLTPYDIVDLGAYYTQYCTPAQDAYYDNETKTVVKEVVGYGFDLAAANQQLALAEEGSVIEIPLEVMEPEVTAEAYMDTYFPDVLASFNSPYPYNPNRTTNLVLACEAIDGTVLQPGEVFSFNSTVGERTAEKGYKEGIIYADGGSSESEVGGGICQVASTIYYCALLADLQIVEREPHMYVVTYVKEGCDATVYWGSLDFKFKNDNSTPLMIKAEASDSYVRIQLVGTNEHDYTIKMTSECVSTIPYEEIETLDETKPVGYRELVQEPHTGYVYWSYKNYYDLDGNFIKTEKCDISEYSKYDAKYIVGPEEPEEPEEPEFPEDPDLPEDPMAPDGGEDSQGGNMWDQILNGSLFS